jgi:hypothetical protein
MSLAQHLQKQRGPARPRALHLYNSRQKSEETEFSESAWSMASTLRSDFQTKGACRFTPSEAFSPEENAILLKLSQELNQFQQDDIISIVEEITLASQSRRDSESAQSAVSKRISRLSVASMTILEGLVFEEEGYEEEDECEEELAEDKEEDDNLVEGEEKELVEDEVTVSETQPEEEEEEEEEKEERQPQDDDDGEEEEDEEPAELVSKPEKSTTLTRSNGRKSKRRSTLAALIHSRRPSSLAELVSICQDGAETWSRNLETILKGDWNGKIVNLDDEFDDGDLTEEED